MGRSVKPFETFSFVKTSENPQGERDMLDLYCKQTLLLVVECVLIRGLIMKIYPSLISADLLNLETVIKNVEGYSDGLHIDVMDDHFVPNLTWGPAFISAIAKKTQLPLDIHLMVDNPGKWVDRISVRPHDIITFHIEAVEKNKVAQLISDFKNKDCNVGIAVNPKTPINAIFDFIDDLDSVLLMSVEPGCSGQSFIESVVEKIQPLIDIRTKDQLLFEICMDGGIGKDNIVMLKEKGVDAVGVASAIFSCDDYVKALQDLKKC